MEFRVFAFNLFHNVYVYEGALWLDLNLLIDDLFISYSSAATSFDGYEGDQNFDSILASKIGRGLAVLCKPTLMFALSSFSSKQLLVPFKKELVVGTDLFGWCLFIFGYL